MHTWVVKGDVYNESDACMLDSVGSGITALHLGMLHSFMAFRAC